MLLESARDFVRDDSKCDIHSENEAWGNFQNSRMESNDKSPYVNVIVLPYLTLLPCHFTPDH
jgi:hypothetical protein